jgi:hypothetical protein
LPPPTGCSRPSSSASCRDVTSCTGLGTAFARGNSLDGLSSLSNIPAKNLLIILVGMPLIAAAAGWLLAGREPRTLAHQPIE